MTFDELYIYLADLIKSGKITLDEIKNAVDMREKMEDDKK